MAEKKYVSDDAQLMSEWDWEKNNTIGLKPTDTTLGSRKNAWWLCSMGHSYDARVSNKAILRRGCPICSGKRVISGINDLATHFPNIASEWDYEKNDGLTPSEVVPHSNRKVWWKCSRCGNSWEQDCNHRTGRKTGCPYCSGRVAIPGVNDLATINPELVKEWHPTKNLPLLPCDLLPQSNRIVWWVCEKGHEYQANTGNRHLGTGCPICAGKQILVGHNDLNTTHPHLTKEWNYTKNKGLRPTEVTFGSHRKVWWVCTKGHEWEASVSNRARKDYGCPICGNQQLLIGYNDLQSVNPELACEWHTDRNGDLKPSDVFCNTNFKVWWICRKGHEWQATPNHRSQGHGCPICSSELHTSFPEQCVLFYLGKVTYVLSREKKHGKEIDVFLPEHSVGIEYDGRFYHKGKEASGKNKRFHMNSYGIRVITIHESDEYSVSGDNIHYVYDFRNKSNLEWAIKRLFEVLCLPCPDIDIARDEILIFEQFIQLEKENSIAAKQPALAQEWHPTKNGRLTPEMLSHQSNMKVWWLGMCGHEWYADVSHRANGRGCPYCSNKRVLKGFNDLATTNPQLVEEWHYQKNTVVSPDAVTQGSNKKVWWKCARGHEWQAVISSRNSGNGCPYCSGRSLLTGVNDLLAVYPSIAAEWHPTKNGSLLPSQISSRNRKKVWWVCSRCNYEWETRVVHRANGHGCPVCSRKKRPRHSIEK